MLNVGAGSTTIDEPGRRSVDVDSVRPDRIRSGRFVRADAAALPFRAGAFDAVVAKDVLEHVDDVALVLDELHRVSSDGCRLVVLTPRDVPRAVWSDPTHKRGFTRVALIGCLRRSRWEPIEGPHRMGSMPLAGRLGLPLTVIEAVLRVPGFGHRFGTNHLVTCRRRDG